MQFEKLVIFPATKTKSQIESLFFNDKRAENEIELIWKRINCVSMIKARRTVRFYKAKRTRRQPSNRRDAGLRFLQEETVAG
jgi:hypothetical protein